MTLSILFSVEPVRGGVYSKEQLAAMKFADFVEGTHDAYVYDQQLK